MNWFVAKMIFQIESENKDYAQFDEQLQLIEAVNEELALEMAHQMGIMQQNEIISKQEQSIKWKFIAITELSYIGEIESGKEIHYRICEPDNVSEYLEMVKDKADSLKNRKITF